MNWGVLLVVLGVGLAAALVAYLWPYLHPESPFWAQQRLADLVRTWEGVRDLRAAVTIQRPGEPRLHLRVLYLAGAAVRLEVEQPAALAGEVYTLRPIEEGWLFVHFRPRLGLGLETRFTSAELQAFLSPPAWAKGEVHWVNENSFVLRQLGVPIAEAEIQVAGEFRLPHRLLLKETGGTGIEVQVDKIEVNRGVELRELLILDPVPTRWLRIPPLPVPGAYSPPPGA